MMAKCIPAGVSALIETALLFLPAGPAFIWLWPNVKGTPWFWVAQSLVYAYFLVGSLWVGLRRWTPAQLGLHSGGLALSLSCGGVILAILVVGRLALSLPPILPPFDPLRLAGVLAFYLILVGGVEELLFRGLIYRAFQDWAGTGLAIAGSSLWFGLWHVGQGLAGVLGGLFFGLLFALIRWRAGGIAGLILVHGAYDVAGTLFWPGLEPEAVLRSLHVRSDLALVGDGLVFGLVIYLWLLYPRLRHGRAHSAP